MKTINRIELYNKAFEGKFKYPALLDGKDCELDDAIEYMADNQSFVESSTVAGEKQFAFFFKNTLVRLAYNRRTNVFGIYLTDLSVKEDFIDMVEELLFNGETELINKFFFYKDKPNFIGVSVYFRPEVVE